MSDSLTLTPYESIQIKRSTPDVLEVEATYLPGGKKPPSHIHPAQDEHFEVLSGRVEVVAGDEERVLGFFPPGRDHRHPAWHPTGWARPATSPARALADHAGRPDGGLVPCDRRPLPPGGSGATGCRGRSPTA